jgi:hypothetical protein
MCLGVCGGTLGTAATTGLLYHVISSDASCLTSAHLKLTGNNASFASCMQVIVLSYGMLRSAVLDVHDMLCDLVVRICWHFQEASNEGV